MKVLPLAKKMRTLLRHSSGVVTGALELTMGALLVLLTGRFAPKISDDQRVCKSLIICPSPLLNGLKINTAKRAQYVISFVNSASLSPTFLTLRPNRFFLIDPAFFHEPDEDQRQTVTFDEIEKTVGRVVEKTNWPMTVVVPWHYRNSTVAARFRSNPNITVEGMPMFASRSSSSSLKQLGLKLGILSPIYRNVLIAAVFYSLRAGHRCTIIWGAHHTWLAEVSVDEHNQVLHSVRHTEKQRVGTPLLDINGARRPYHDYLQQLATVFEQYHVLQAYAQNHDQDILNATVDSFIDAFARIKWVNIFSNDDNTSELTR